MKASVVIPTYNSKEFVESCLLSLNHQTIRENDDFEVIVVDDGSNDGTEEMVKSLELRFPLIYLYKVRTPSSTRSAARNYGATKATGEILIFLDGDHVVPPNFVKEHLETHANQEDLAVMGFRKHLHAGEVDKGKLKNEFSLNYIPQVFRDELRFEVVYLFSENMSNVSAAWHLFYSCNVSLRREQFQKVIGFDEGFHGWGLEDSELGYKLFLQGMKFVYNKNACIYHLNHPVDEEKRGEGWRRNYAYFIQKYNHDVRAMAQTLLDPSMLIKQKSPLPWLDNFLVFEEINRILDFRKCHGRFKLLNIYDQDEDLASGRILHKIRTISQKENLIVLNFSSNTSLDIDIQTFNPEHELIYFNSPGYNTISKLFERVATVE